MEGVLKSDIFFFITSLVVILIGIGSVMVFFYLVNILRDVKDVSRTVKEETRGIAEDLSQLRTKVKTGGVVVGVLTFFRRLLSRSKKGRKHSKGN